MSHSAISSHDVTTLNGEVSGPGELLPAFMVVTGNGKGTRLQSLKTYHNIIMTFLTILASYANIQNIFCISVYCSFLWRLCYRIFLSVKCDLDE